MHFIKWAAFLPLLCITQCAPDIYVEGEQKYLNGVGVTITKFGQLEEAIKLLYEEEVAVGKELILCDIYRRRVSNFDECKPPLLGFQDYHNLRNYTPCNVHYSFVSRPFWHILSGKVTAFLPSEDIVHDHLQTFADLKAFALADSGSRTFDLLAYGSETPSDDTLLTDLHGKYFVIVDRPYLKIEGDDVVYFLEDERVEKSLATVSNFGQLNSFQSMQSNPFDQIPYKLHYVGPGSQKEETPLKQLNGKDFSTQRFASDSV